MNELRSAGVGCRLALDGAALHDAEGRLVAAPANPDIVFDREWAAALLRR